MFNGGKTLETRLLSSNVKQARVFVGRLFLAQDLHGSADKHNFRRTRQAFNTLILEPMGGRDIGSAKAFNHRAPCARAQSVRSTAATWTETFRIINNQELLHADQELEAMKTEHGVTTL